MASAIRVTLQFERFGDVLRDVKQAARKEVRGAAYRVRDGARVRARVDTAAMRDGIYVACGPEDGYPESEAVVNARRPGHALGPVRPPTEDGLSAVVAVVADYTFSWEYGGHNGHQPMLTPAAAVELPRFLEGLRAIL